MVTFVMMSAKLTTPGLLNIKVFWNKSYDVTTYVHNVTNQILSHDSNHVDVVMWPKFGNSSKFNNLGLALCTNLKLYTSVAKGLKQKVRKSWGLVPTFVEVTGEKLVGGLFAMMAFFRTWLEKILIWQKFS